MLPCYAAAKELHFNRNGEALKRMQAGVDKLASVVGVTLGPKVGVVFVATRGGMLVLMVMCGLGARRAGCKRTCSVSKTDKRGQFRCEAGLNMRLMWRHRALCEGMSRADAAEACVCNAEGKQCLAWVFPSL